MKHYSLVSITIPILMLLSGCGHYAVTTSSVAFEGFTGQPSGKITVPLPNYVKHNESIKNAPISNATPPTKASIAVELTTPDSTKGQQYIQYSITDTYSLPVIGGLIGCHKGRWHHKDAVTFENKDCDLFSTPFTKLPLVTPFGNEVKISGDDAYGRPHTWVSCQNKFADDDVTWRQPQQQCQ